MAWPVDPKMLHDLNEVRRLTASAERLHAHDLVTACLHRIAELEGRRFANPLERRFWEIISVFEEMLTKKITAAKREPRAQERK